MGSLRNPSLTLLPTIPSLENVIKSKFITNLAFPEPKFASLQRKSGIYCKLSGHGTQDNPISNSTITKSKKNSVEEYNIAMKKMMRNPYEYHHDLG